MKSELLFKAILGGVPAGIFVVDTETWRLIYVNNFLCRMLGYSEEICIRMKLSDFFSTDDFEKILDGIKSLSSKKSISDIFAVRSDKSVFPGEIAFTAMQLDGKRCVSAFLTDISEHRKTGDALGESEARNRSILQAIPDLMFINDREGKYLDYHAGDESLLAFRPEEILHTNVKDVFTPDISDEIFGKFEKAFETGKVQIFEYSLDLPVGQKFFEARISPMDSGRLLTIVRDISERRKAEESYRRLRSLEGLGTVAGGIAHDFNNFLMGIFGFIEIAEKELPGGHKAALHLESAHRELDNARKLANRLLTFSKEGDPVLETVDLRQRICETVNFNLVGSNIGTEFDIPDDLWPVRVDRVQITEVISNLTINARQAMDRGGKFYVTARNISDIDDEDAPDLSGDYVEFRFRDEGGGIKKEVVRRIFEPYFTTRPSGTGLGLAVVHGIITRHKGFIKIKSVQDVGTTFTVLLPADIAPSSALEENQETGVKTERKNHSGGRILLMDDDEAIRHVVALMLNRLGYITETAEDGSVAIEKYRDAMEEANPFDLAIMDLTVPGGMGGKEAFEKMQKIDPRIKVIFSSGYFADSIPCKSDHDIRTGCLAKPFSLEELDSAVKSMLVT